MSSDDQCITVATEESICELLRAAKRRLVFLAPALHTRVGTVLADCWKALGPGKVSVILDLDPEVFRLGYGEIGAVQLLEETASALGTMIQRQPGIRIGLVISDDVTLVYSPTPLLIEAGRCSPKTPNAIRLDHTPPGVVRELGHGENGVRDQKVGLDKATRQDIGTIEADLKRNPPQKFDVARRIHVFNAHFEFVEFSLTGTHIDRKTVRIPGHLMGVVDPKTRDQLNTTLQLLGSDSKLSGEHLKHDKELIAKRYLKTLPNYGTVVLRTEKDKFLEEVKLLEAAVEKFRQDVRAELEKELESRRKSLVDAFLPSVKNSPPKEWVRSDGKVPDEESLRQFIDDDLRQSFGSADRLIRHMEVTTLFKGVTYESLKDEDFVKVASKAIPSLRQLYSESEASEGTSAQEGKLF